jgi:hypothetical protein
VTLDELFAEHHVTDEERRALVWHLAAFRMRRLIETLLPTAPIKKSILRKSKL